MYALFAGVALTALLSLSGLAQAGSSVRTYVSVKGSDSAVCTPQFPCCTVAAPCRTLNKALPEVAFGGEIWILDSGNFNGTTTLAINKSVTILAVPGALGSLNGYFAPAISIDTPGGDVTLRNLNVQNAGDNSAYNGIEIHNASNVVIDRCEVRDFSGGWGIHARNSLKVHVADTIVRGSWGSVAGGIWFDMSTGSLSRVTVVHNRTGVRAAADAGFASGVIIDDSFIAHNLGNGVLADGPGFATISVTRSSSSYNVGTGFFAAGPTGKITVSGSSAVSNQGYGMAASGASAVLTFGNNDVSDNNPDIGPGVSPISLH